ncbi:CHAT domain-containing tetratricopeptide repeat protein [Calothrix sp. UHCC 0171]|uniref:CHAT domain-containing protein n=1 Tax=Calothrix sp. UHCC 0171 TaxID=3110245 RepID=UPI002B21F448|nr:CHAT domain-containing tetratricopeptide repeat protein [Calothrix sp. UHCC 0171]MEA5574026.1 CHAT domain-containing tetratricopeptide repeat protein [Calothrix sp. UHCC 0171]
MRFDKVGLGKLSLNGLIFLLVIFSTSFDGNLPILSNTSKVFAQTIDARKNQADQLLEQGIDQFQTGNLKAALLSYEKALQIYRQIKDRTGEAQALGNLGNAYYILGDYRKAIDFHQQSLVIFRQIGDRAGEGRSLGNLGVAYNALGEYQKAIEFHQQRLKIAKELGDRPGIASALSNLGSVYFSLGEYQKAIEFHQQRLAISKELGDRSGVGKALLNLGNVYYYQGEFPKAIDFYQQALTIFPQIGDRRGEGLVLGNLGAVYSSLGEYQKAIKLYQQSLAIATEIGDRAQQATRLNNLGNAYSDLGEPQKTVEFLQQALKVFQQIGDRPGEGNVLGSLGNAYYSQGDYKQAIDFHQQSLAIFKKIGDRSGEGGALGGLGNIYNSLGEYQKAIEFHQQRLQISKQIGERTGESAALTNLGNAYGSLKDYQKAIESYQQALALDNKIGNRSGIGKALGNLGTVYDALGDYQKAIDFYQQRLKIAKEIGERSGEASVLTNLGNVYDALGEPKKAIDFQQQALGIFKQIGDRFGEGAALNNLGSTFRKSGNLSAAERVLKQGIEVWKSQRGKLADRNDLKISIFEQQTRTYEILQRVLIAQNKTDAALEVSENGRARAFVDLLISRLQPNSNASTEININQIKQIAKSQNAILVQYSIITDEFKIAGKEQSKESELYIWVIKPTGEITFRKADLKPLWQKENTTLKDIVTITRESIGVRGTAFRGIDVSYNPDAPKAVNRLKRLHELLIAPIADLLPKNPNARVTFIPQASLFLVPFPALQDKDGKYLIEKHTILTSPSIQVLDLTRKQKQRIGNKPIQGNNMLIVGNPTMPAVSPKIGEVPQQLSALPGAELEANAIAKLFKTQSLIGNQATETEVTKRLFQAQFIHFATHGLFDDIQGLNSSIALASGNKNNEKSDGLLTAGEILDLKLNAELVVLSACDTGRGKISGDGVIGLSRSLISAGVPSVLVSLWAVPDAPTAELMTEFYQNLQKSPDKAQALRQAMLKTMKQHPNPSAWAAFTLIGEAE